MKSMDYNANNPIESHATEAIVRFLFGLVCLTCAGTTVSATAVCSDASTVAGVFGPSCTGLDTTAFAHVDASDFTISGLPGLTVSAQALYIGNPLDNNRANAMATVDGNFMLTLFGAYGQAVVRPCFAALASESTLLGNAAISARVGGSVYSPTVPVTSGDCANGIGQMVTFGAPTPVHISLMARASVEGLPNASGTSAIALQNFMILDPLNFNAPFSGVSFTLTDAAAIPEPGSLGLGGIALLALLYRHNLRHSRNPTC